MKKFISILILCILLSFQQVYAKKFNTGIIFNVEPFTPKTAVSSQTTFKTNERIYWLFMSRKQIDTQFIRFQVVQATDKGPLNTLPNIVYTHEYKINRDSPFFFTDYFVLHSKGHYYIQIFDRSRLNYKPIARAQIFVK